MQLMPKIQQALPVVLKQIRLIQKEFEDEVTKQYEKQAFNKHTKSSTPLEEDQLWMRVLPQEIADILPNILADCPQSIVEKFQQELDKSKVPAPDTLKQLLSAAQR